ncbi:hypothetical protein APR04_004380 [Promicromonospora umidemergens]|uniref:WXG100 family type VII secretion target n=1 Tax=Promicromonospora umidemergens TaxID=629679 RepID=A0ABP8XQH3_9MICO|nr:hypothetical protein [Promicromonospora umidemergens]MCP2285448.1 hypothetical protein [Promicromonospora umidemergens]
MAHYEHIGYDPTPGEHEVVGGMSDDLTAGHETIRRIHFLLSNINEGEWAGSVAMAFRSTMSDDFAPKVSEVEKAFEQAATALATWAGKLSHFRTDADGLNHRLGVAKAELEAARSSYYGAEDPTRPGDDATEAEQDEYQADQRSRQQTAENMSSAQGVVDGIWSEIEVLVGSYATAAQALLSAFETAAALAPDDPSWWDKAVDWAGDQVDAIKDGFAAIGDIILEWAAEHAGLLNSLSNILSIGSMIAGFASLIPGPWSPFLAGLSVGLGAASTLAGFLSAAGQGGSWSAGLTPGVIVGAIGTALGAGAVFATFRGVASAATAAGRVAPTFGQFMNPMSRVGTSAVAAFPGFFSMAARGGTIATTAELGWRALDVTIDQATWIVTNPLGVMNMGWSVERDGDGALLANTLENQEAR